jgi:hypothetical protein
VWPDLVDAFTGFDEAGIDVIVDLGRMDRQGLPQPLLDRADLVVLLLRTSLRAIAAARGYAAMLREQSRLSGADTNIGLGLVGENQPYGRREIAKLLNLPVVTALADDPDSASTFSDGIRRHRRFDRAALPRSLRNAVDDVTGQIRRRRARLGLDESAPPVAPPGESVPGQGGDVAQVSDSARTTAVGSGVAAEVGDRMPAGTGGDPRG